jgi:phosphoadenosine phosphosulfate reductase
VIPTPANGWTPARAANVDLALGDAPLERVLAWAVSEFGRGLALATGFGPQSIVLMHALSRIDPGVTVFYLDTGLLFRETYELRDRLARRLGLELVRVEPELSVAEQGARHGPALWSRDPDRCCELRKVRPLEAFLRERSAWITGIRRSQTAARARAGVVEWDARHGLVKINPVVHWSDERVRSYLERHDLPVNPLHAQGYPSIGCEPCTRPVRPGEDPRAGRWAGHAKTECGIHLPLGRPATPACAAGTNAAAPAAPLPFAIDVASARKPTP